MSADLHEILGRLNRRFLRLAPDEQAYLQRALSDIADMAKLERARGSLRSDNTLRRLANYTRRQLAHLAASKREGESLLALRNSIVHGSALPPQRELRSQYATLWRALDRSASLWNPSKLFNLLVYCLRIPPPEIDPEDAGSERVIRVFKALFDAFTDDRKISVFRELLLRLTASEEFRRFLRSLEDDT